MRKNQLNRFPNPGLIPGRQAMTVEGLSQMYGFLIGKPLTGTDALEGANTVRKIRAKLAKSASRQKATHQKATHDSQ